MMTNSADTVADLYDDDDLAVLGRASDELLSDLLAGFEAVLDLTRQVENLHNAAVGATYYVVGADERRAKAIEAARLGQLWAVQTAIGELVAGTLPGVVAQRLYRNLAALGADLSRTN